MKIFLVVHTYLALSIYTLQKIMFMLEEIVYFMVKEPKGKTYLCFLISKVWKILKHFSRQFHQTKTSHWLNNVLVLLPKKLILY